MCMYTPPHSNLSGLQHIAIHSITLFLLLFIFFSSRFAYILRCGWQKTAILSQMPPKVICGSLMTKIGIFLGSNCQFGGSKMPNFANQLCCSKCPQKSCGGLFNDQNVPFLWSKIPAKKCFVPNVSKVIWKCPMTKICIFMGQNCPKTQMPSNVT